MLKQEGFQVEVAHEGPTALELARNFLPEVVVLDLGLPGMDGFEVALHLRAIAELNGLLLIAASGYDRESDRQRTRESGFDHHLAKPVDIDQLLSLIRAPR